MDSITKFSKGSRLSELSCRGKRDERRLRYAAFRKDRERFLGLLEGGGNPISCDENGPIKFSKGSRFSKPIYLVKKDERRLRYAASRNDTDRLLELLESGVDPNACDENGRTALHLASASGYSSIVKLLLTYKADCNVVDKLGNTPLHLAVCTTSTPTINLLLNAGCSALQKGHNGCTPLHLAQTKLKLLQKCYSPDHYDLKLKISEIIDKMKMLVEDSVQEKKLADLISSKLLLQDSTDIAGDLNCILQTLNELQL